ncbi:neuronal acetylcholine receptor subunit alpha-9-like [Lineus longissimus]|uniref:neuronal acetylcholine receptor subunit alpha-9-like n=1 Tax=Lineus longissimus TaxID=88925 RepID=UPI002B4CB48C
MLRHGLICVVFLQQFIALALSEGSYPYYARLYNDLFQDYNPRLLPAKDASAPVNSTIGMTLINLKLDTSAGSLYTNVWLQQDWHDFRLQWDPEGYDGITQITVPYDQVWRPDMSLFNSDKPQDMNPPSDEGNVVVFSSGNVLFVRHVGLSSLCMPNDQGPNGEQHCEMKIGSWVNSGYRLDVYNSNDKIDLTSYAGNPDWTITKTLAKRHVRHYSCCPEPYVDITFSIWFKEK